MTNYGWSADGIFGDVFETVDPVDNEMVFGTFASARKALADHFDSMAWQYRDAARFARKLRKTDALDHAPRREYG